MSQGNRRPLIWPGAYQTMGADSLVSQPSAGIWKASTMAMAAQ
jgi:hypothetical protein